MKVKYDYTFIFDPSETWSNKYQIDEFLAKSLKEIGFVAERVDNYGKGGETLIIRKLLPPAQEKVSQTVSVKEQKYNLKQKTNV